MAERKQDSTQDVQFTWTKRGHGKLMSESAEFSVASFTLTKSKYDYGSPWTLSGSISEGESPTFSRDFHLYGSFTLEGRTANDEEVRAQPVLLSSLEGNHFTAAVQEVQIGSGRLAKAPSDQSVTIFLTPTELAPRQVPIFYQYWTGEVKGEGEKAAVQKWRSSLGTFDLFTRFEFEKTELGGLASTISVPRPTLFLSLRDESRTTEVSELITSLRQELAPLTRLLTFLSRRNVDWCEFEIHSREALDTASAMTGLTRETTVLRKATRTTPRQAGIDPLIDVRLLPEFGINSMLEALLKLPFRDAVISSIGFLVAGQEGYVENAVISSFTALETIVYAISEHQGRAYILEEEDFQKLRASLMIAIKAHGRENSINASQRAALYGKLSELRRAPIVGQIVRVLEQHTVTWTDLWPSGVVLEAELRSSYGRRSMLIHSGRILDYDRALEDSMRMHALSERLIYTMVGGRPEWLSPWAYSHIIGLRGSTG